MVYSLERLQTRKLVWGYSKVLPVYVPQYFLLRVHRCYSLFSLVLEISHSSWNCWNTFTYFALGLWSCTCLVTGSRWVQPLQFILIFVWCFSGSLVFMFIRVIAVRCWFMLLFKAHLIEQVQLVICLRVDCVWSFNSFLYLLLQKLLLLGLLSQHHIVRQQNSKIQFVHADALKYFVSTI